MCRPLTLAVCSTWIAACCAEVVVGDLNFKPLDWHELGSFSPGSKGGEWHIRLLSPTPTGVAQRGDWSFRLLLYRGSMDKVRREPIPCRRSETAHSSRTLRVEAKHAGLYPFQESVGSGEFDRSRGDVSWTIAVDRCAPSKNVDSLALGAQNFSYELRVTQGAAPLTTTSLRELCVRSGIASCCVATLFLGVAVHLRCGTGEAKAHAQDEDAELARPLRGVGCRTTAPWIVLPCVQLAAQLLGAQRILRIAANGAVLHWLEGHADVFVVVVAPLLLTLSPGRDRHVRAQMASASMLLLVSRQFLLIRGAGHAGDAASLLLLQAVALLAAAVWHVVAAATLPLSWGARQGSHTSEEPSPWLLLCSVALTVAALCVGDTRSMTFMWILHLGHLAPLWCALPPPWRVRLCSICLSLCLLTVLLNVHLRQSSPAPLVSSFNSCEHVPPHTPLVLFDGEMQSTKKWLARRRGPFAGRQPVFYLNSAIPDLCVSLVNAFRDPRRKHAYPSAGCVAVFLAAQVCTSVSLYGFGPDGALDAGDKGVAQRYSSTGDARWITLHDFPAEHALYRGFVEAQSLGVGLWQNRISELGARNKSGVLQEKWRRAVPWLTTALQCVTINYPGPGARVPHVSGVCGAEAPKMRLEARSVSDCVALGRLSLSPFAASLASAKNKKAHRVRCELFVTCPCAETRSCPSKRERKRGWTIQRTGVTSDQREEANASECWHSGREHTLLRGLARVTVNAKHPVLSDPSVLVGPSRRHDTCALVGSGTELMNQSLGTAIDAHDQVWRLNRAPEVMLSSRVWRHARADALRRDVGERTDVVVTNHHAWDAC